MPGPLRTAAQKLLRLNASPHGIALGFSLGLGLSLIPIPFLGMVLALAIAPLLGASLPAVYAGTAVVNPLTGAAFYFAELWLGSVLTGVSLPPWSEANTYDWQAWWQLFTTMLPTFLLGALSFVVMGSALSYPVLWVLVRRVQGQQQADAGPSADPDPASTPSQPPRPD